MKIEMCPTVAFGDIEEKFGLSYGDYNFTDMAENGAYVFFALDEDEIEARKEDIAYAEEAGDGNSKYCKRLRNELALIEYFNSIGYNDAILICVCW